MNKYLPLPRTHPYSITEQYWVTVRLGRIAVIPEVKTKRPIKVNYGNSIQLSRGQDRPMGILHYRIYPQLAKYLGLESRSYKIESNWIELNVSWREFRNFDQLVVRVKK